eukprot:SAG31_NODE_1065_length_10096_cov_7.151530_12_plen_157_part_00
MQLFEEYGTLIERYTALIEKVSALIGCFTPPPPAPGVVSSGTGVDAGPLCAVTLKLECAAEQKRGAAACLACAGKHAAVLQHHCTQAQLEALCNGTAPSPGPAPSPSPSPWPPHHRSRCDYDQQAGAVWNQRLKVRRYFLVFVPTIREIRDFYREM